MSDTKQPNGSGLIYTAIPAIMSELPSILKDRKNEKQGYKFRGIDDVYNAVNPILAKHGVFMRAEVLDKTREERPSNSGGVLAFVQVSVRYYFVTKDGSSISTDSLGEGMDSGDKATPKAMSIAQKYAILQMFCVPTADAKDPEPDDPDPAPKPKPPAPAPTKDKPAGAKPDRIAAGIKAMKDLGKSDDQIWTGIRKEVSEKCNGRKFAEISELNAAEAEIIIEYLTRWFKHIKAGKKAAAAKHEAEDAGNAGDAKEYGL